MCVCVCVSFLFCPLPSGYVTKSPGVEILSLSTVIHSTRLPPISVPFLGVATRSLRGVGDTLELVRSTGGLPEGKGVDI